MPAPACSQVGVEKVPFIGGLDVDANRTIFVESSSPVDPMTYEDTEVDKLRESLGNGTD